MDKERIVERMDAVIESELDYYCELSDRFAAEPEIGSQEYRTSAALADSLAQRGFDMEYPYGGIKTAFNAVCRNGDGPVIAFLAEYDALPEIGHACGHNMNGVISALAGVALAEALPECPGEIRVVGTPAEETNGAKVVFADQGVFDNVDLAVMFHVTSGTGKVKYRSLAMHAMEFTFKGKPAHAAVSPWEGINALNGAQLFFHAIDMLRQHVRPEVRMHGIVVQGGSVPNVVPDSAVVRFYFRAPWKKYLNEVMSQVFNCARGAALATGTDVSWQNYEYSFDEVLGNGSAEKALTCIMEELNIPFSDTEERGGSSDIGNVSWRCPVLQPMIAVSSQIIPAHTLEFSRMVSGGPEVRCAVSLGARALARMGLAVLTDDVLRRNMREDFEMEKTRTPY